MVNRFLNVRTHPVSDDLSAVASCQSKPWRRFMAKEGGVPLAVARKAFGGDPKDIIEELNEILVA